MGVRHTTTEESNFNYRRVDSSDRVDAVGSASAPSPESALKPKSDVSRIPGNDVVLAAFAATASELAELARFLRLQALQGEREYREQLKLHRRQTSAALAGRLERCGHLAHRALVNKFRLDDKKGFATLYNAVQDVRDSCDATRRFAMLDSDLGWDAREQDARDPSYSSPRKFSTFLQSIPSRTREDLLAFVSRIRTDPDFLASRLTSLSKAELTSLTAFHRCLDPVDSVLPSNSRGTAHSSVHNRIPGHRPTAVEHLLSFERHDPLSTLLYTIFADSSGPGSLEDLQRTEIWSSACARLIVHGSSGGEHFMRVVLNAWAAMRDWPVRGRLELYLLQVLQQGASILEKAEDASSPGSRPLVESHSPKDALEAEQFYDTAVVRLFELIDSDPNAGGIPEGVLELANAILRKLDGSKKQRTAQTFIVSKWFFSTFLMNAVIHPESHGMVLGHHVTDHARHKILKEIATRASKHVWDLTYNWKQSTPIHPDIRKRVERILLRFNNARLVNTKSVLLPAKDATSPHQTMEAQSFLVFSPTDIISLVRALYPERRPSSSPFDKPILQTTDLQSSASSISSGTPWSPQQTLVSPGPLGSGSFVSVNGSSVTSVATSRGPLLDTSSGTTDANSSYTSFGSHETLQNNLTSTGKEDYGATMRAALAEMVQHLNLDTNSATCHPCAETWGVVYVSADGNGLYVDSHDTAASASDIEDLSSSESETEDEIPAKAGANLDFGQFKETITELLAEYEIPEEQAPGPDPGVLSNRPTTLTDGASESLVTDLPSAPSGAPLGDSSQLANVNERTLSGDPRSSDFHLDTHDTLHPSRPRSPSVLLAMLEAAVDQCQARSDFIGSHNYWLALEQLRDLSDSIDPAMTHKEFAPLTSHFVRRPRDALTRSANAIEEYEAWSVGLKQSQQRHDAKVENQIQQLKGLRDKMWYITDVKHSAEYEEARNIANALRAMARPAKSPDSRTISSFRSRSSLARPLANVFPLKTEAQLVNIMTAPPEQGGPPKLSDEQSEMTKKWLRQGVIENLCKGEELLHRFCLEIDRCTNKVVGNQILEGGAVLWSGELYQRDKWILDGTRQNSNFLAGGPNLSMAGQGHHSDEAQRTIPRGLDFPSRGLAQDLRSMSIKNASHHSFDSGNWSVGPGSVYSDPAGSPEYLFMPSSRLNIDTTWTFWSPFRDDSPSSPTSCSDSPRSSARGIESGASVSLEDRNLAKRTFLLDLKQTLIGLLLSDLGTLVCGRGSETDSWLFGKFGDKIMQMKTGKVPRGEEDSNEGMVVGHTGMVQLGGPIAHFSALGNSGRAPPAAPVATLENTLPVAQSSEGTSSPSAVAARFSSSEPMMKPATTRDFPYHVGFKRLLNKFSAQSNPASKLEALHELELLIVASLSSSSRHSRRRRQNTLLATPPSIGGPRHELAVRLAHARTLDDIIANCEYRRSHATAAGADLSLRPGLRHGRRCKMQPSADEVVEVFGGLFRDPDSRPKFLFRDLQSIAAFTPFSVLHETKRGQAFWSAGLAALGLKRDMCRAMVEVADKIVAHHTQNRSLSPNGRGPDGQQRGEHERFSMQDAARMWSITAKEGDPVAQRELAIFYLTHPDLLSRTTLPLSKPRDTFKAQVMSQRDEDPMRSDPATMCVAYHWMELSSQGGDDLARTYLRAREEMNALP